MRVNAINSNSNNNKINPAFQRRVYLDPRLKGDSLNGIVQVIEFFSPRRLNMNDANFANSFSNNGMSILESLLKIKKESLMKCLDIRFYHGGENINYLEYGGVNIDKKITPILTCVVEKEIVVPDPFQKTLDYFHFYRSPQKIGESSAEVEAEKLSGSVFENLYKLAYEDFMKKLNPEETQKFMTYQKQHGSSDEKAKKWVNLYLDKAIYAAMERFF